jgi:hypothetical protein
MKRFFLLLLTILSVLSLSSNVFAANDNAFYVNNAYNKGNGKYDIVVRGPAKETLQLYVNDKNPVKAKVNKEGWATFKKVKLSRQSKLSFAKRVKLFKYEPINYVKYIKVDNDHVELSDTGAKHSYEEFYAWLIEPFDLQTKMNLQYGLFSKNNNNYQLINDVCTYTDNKFGTQWVACMQKGFKDYLKPDTFVNDNWTGDYSTMVGDMNYAGPKNDQYNHDMQEARKIYERLAITN